MDDLIYGELLRAIDAEDPNTIETIFNSVPSPAEFLNSRACCQSAFFHLLLKIERDKDELTCLRPSTVTTIKLLLQNGTRVECCTWDVSERRYNKSILFTVIRTGFAQTL